MSKARHGSSPPPNETSARADDKAAAPDPSSADKPANDKKRSGRVTHDERGNSVWEWQLETGVYSRDISTQRLKKLDLDDLSIAETGSVPRPPGLGDPPGPKTRPGPLPGGGFNPYDNSSSARGKVGGNPYNSAGGGALKPAPRRKPADMRKLDEWLELRKRVGQNKREDSDD